MKINLKMSLTLLTGVALGAIAVQGLHAQSKPHAYTVVEVDVTNPDAYAKEFLPLGLASVKNSGGKALVVAQNAIALDGTPPKRVGINVWDSLEKAQAWHNSAEYKAARQIGDKYATFRIYAVEGLPQ